MSSVRGMSIGLEAELCLALEVCPVSCKQNSVLRQGYAHWPGGEALSCIRSMSSVRVTEVCRLSGVCLYPSGRILSCIGVCPVA
ncbi:hypothetical protein TNCV_1531211 [Trichonephila clavipes]|nr:hypothetical protein TNCV_1531211 [Trichonephila clavipes]